MIKLDGSTGENFCIAPWVNLHIQTTGEIKPCCGGGGNKNGHFGLAQNKEWSYINGTSKPLSELKRTLLNNIESNYCKNCQEKPWYSSFISDGVEIKSVDDFVLKSIDLRWGNTCQLSCLYCNAGSSSTWQRLENKKKKSIPISSRPYQTVFEDVFAFIKNSGRTISRFSMLGGEPLLLKENLRLLESLPSTANGEIFSNLNIDLNNNAIYDRLLLRQNVNWYVSMENTGTRFEFVRRGANWSQQINNIERLLNDTKSKPGHKVYLQSQFCVYSALNIKELYEFSESMGIEINWALLTWPEPLNFLQFPKALKIQCLQDIEHCQKKFTTAWSLEQIKQMLQNSLENEKTQSIEICRQWHVDLERDYFHDQTLNFDQLWPVYRQFQKDSP